MANDVASTTRTDREKRDYDDAHLCANKHKSSYYERFCWI
jgi:hypothetical protein